MEDNISTGQFLFPYVH